MRLEELILLGTRELAFRTCGRLRFNCHRMNYIFGGGNVFVDSILDQAVHFVLGVVTVNFTVADLLRLDAGTARFAAT